MSKMLIIYYSWSNGNTKRIAEMLQEETKADIAVIDTVKPYEGSYDDVVNQGQEEVNLSGKTVIPFMTNGGWPGHVIKDMEKASKGAKCAAPKEIQFDSTGGDHLETSEKEIKQWIEEVKKYL